MKNIIFIFFVFIQLSNAQENKVQDTIFANEYYNTHLFFPDPIKQGVVGAGHFTFSYNEVEAQRFGLLKATPGVDSNLLVITQEGSVYSYILSYRKVLPRLQYFIRRKEKIEEEGLEELKQVQEKKVSSEKAIEEMDSISRKKVENRKAAEYFLNLKPGKIGRKEEAGISLAVGGLRYYGDETIVVLELENSSGITLEIDYLRLYLVNGNNKRSASYQKVQQEQVWNYHEPKVVYHGQSIRFVLGFAKFVPGDHEKILLELRERHGNRLLKLKFDSR